MQPPLPHVELSILHRDGFVVVDDGPVELDVGGRRGVDDLQAYGVLATGQLVAPEGNELPCVLGSRELRRFDELAVDVNLGFEHLVDVPGLSGIPADRKPDAFELEGGFVAEPAVEGDLTNGIMAYEALLERDRCDLLNVDGHLFAVYLAAITLDHFEGVAEGHVVDVVQGDRGVLEV